MRLLEQSAFSFKKCAVVKGSARTVERVIIAETNLHLTVAIILDRFDFNLCNNMCQSREQRQTDGQTTR